MTSRSQIEANRRNACKSTGPNTEEGKQRSRCSVLVDEFDAGGFSINSYDVPEPRRVRDRARLSVIARENLPELNTEEIILDYTGVYS